MVIKRIFCCLALAACLWGLGCGRDTPSGPSEDEVASLAQALAFTFQQGIIAALAGEGRIEGVSGALIVAGRQWRFERYSPAGQVFINGELSVDAAQRPMVVRGAPSLSGTLSGVLEIDLAYNPATGVFNGTLTVDGVQVALSERLCCLEAFLKPQFGRRAIASSVGHKASFKNVSKIEG